MPSSSPPKAFFEWPCAAGAVSITTLRFASQPTASWFRNGGRFPPQDLPPRSSKHLTFPPVIDPAAPPIRPERHVPNSIATMRRRLTVALAQSLERCPCCATHFRRPPHHSRS